MINNNNIFIGTVYIHCTISVCQVIMSPPSTYQSTPAVVQALSSQSS